MEVNYYRRYGNWYMYPHQTEDIFLLLNNCHMSPLVSPDDGKKSQGQFLVRWTQLEVIPEPLTIGQFR